MGPKLIQMKKSKIKLEIEHIIKDNIVYEFGYTDSILISGPLRQSLHYTEKGACLAMDAHKAIAYTAWLENHKWRIANDSDYDETDPMHQFGYGESWEVKPVTILP